MKKVFLTIVVLFMVCVTVFAQSSSRPTESQIRQEAQQYLQQVRTNSTQFDTTMEDHNTRDIANKNMMTLNRLRAEIDQLAASINADQSNIDAELSRGQRANATLLKRIQQQIDQYKIKMADLEAFIERIGAG